MSAKQKIQHQIKSRLRTSKHDLFVKASLKDPKIALSILEQALPSHLFSLIDANSLLYEDVTHVDSALKQVFSDILYSVKLNNKSLKVYILVEHKSQIDKLTHYQLISNAMKIWDKEIFLQLGLVKQKQLTYAKIQLSPMVPLIVYHGKSKWNVKRSFLDLFDNELLRYGFEKYIPHFASEVFDISHLSDDEIRGYCLAQVFQITLKYIFSNEIFSKLKDIFDLVEHAKTANATEYLKIVLRYILSSQSVENKGKITETIESIYTEREKTMKKTAWDGIVEDYIEKGRNEGIEKGILISNALRKGELSIDDIAKKFNVTVDIVLRIQSMV